MTFIQRSRAVGALEKALYHNVEGTGRGKVLRPFFDLNDADEEVITKIIADNLDDIIKA